MVDVAVVGGFIAAREPARHIAAPHERRQHRGRDVAGLWRGVAGMHDRHDLGGAGEFGGQQRGGQQSATEQRRRWSRCGAGRGGRSFPSRPSWAGVSSDSDSSRATTCTTTVLGCIPAAAQSGSSQPQASPSRTVAQGAEGVGAALFEGAWIVLAHCGGHRVEALIEGLGVGGQQLGLNVGGARTVLGGVDIDEAAAGTVLGAPYRRGS